MAVVLDRHCAIFKCIDLGLISREDFFSDVWTVEDWSSRNRNFAVRNRRGEGFFIKSPREPTRLRTTAVECEFRICSVGRQIRQVARHIPAALAWDGASAIAVYRMIDGGTTGAGFLRLHGVEAFGATRAAIRTIADCQMHLGRAVRLGDRELELSRAKPSCFMPENLPRSDSVKPSGGQRALLDYLYSQSRLITALYDLGQTWDNNGLIHGDVKLANLILSGTIDNPKCVLLDWESVGFGDIAWDVAGLVQSILSMWAQTVGAPDADVVPEETTDNLERTRKHIRIVLSEYARRAGLDRSIRSAFDRKAVRFAGARIIQTCYEQSKPEERLVGQVALQVSLAEELLLAPDSFLKTRQQVSDAI